MRLPGLMAALAAVMVQQVALEKARRRGGAALAVTGLVACAAQQCLLRLMGDAAKQQLLLSRFLLQQRLQAQQGTKAEQPVQLLLAEPLMGWAATLAHGLPSPLLHCGGAAPLVPESPERLQLQAVLSMAEAAWPPRRWWVVGLQVASAGGRHRDWTGGTPGRCGWCRGVAARPPPSSWPSACVRRRPVRAPPRCAAL